ncbi:MAG: carboxypeptidase regulatory-like domain-containing protein, partial [Bryobacter sp.]|nr:carboxypeptidase regulatory-like domain-containing protein [Bryobacter sp.]
MRLIRTFVVPLVLLIPVVGQEYRGSLTGRVSDSQGLGVPGARIVLRQLDTGALYEGLSEASGQYVVPLLPPSEYEMTVELKGFKSYKRPRVRVSTGERLGLDVALEVGTLQESIVVTDEVPLLQTATANTGQVLTTRQIENLPMNGRTPLVLAQLANGVVPPSNSGFSRPFDNQGPSEFSMGGAPSRSNEILIDGAPNNTKDNRVAYNPPVDAVQEMKVDTFQSDAAFGNTVGGVVNMVMKSGTNDLHGTAYWFNQVAALNATPFFTNAAAQPKPPMRFNQYGVTVGGPVVLPRVWDGRNKLFFYFAYEGIKDDFPRPSNITVATEAERRGDFSELLKVGSQYQLFDPLTGAREGARVRRQPFAGNIIPAARLNPVAVNAQKFFPVPNTIGRADGLLNYLSSRTGEKNNFWNYLFRGDWNVSARQKLAVNYRNNVRESMGGNEYGCYPTEICGSANGRTRVNHGAAADHVLTLSPTTVLNTRLNFTRFTQGRTNFSEGFDLTSLGFPAALNDAVLTRQFPRFEFNNFFRYGDGGSNRNPQDVFQIFTTLNKMKGNHSLKFGTDLRLYRDNYNVYDWPVGRYQFSTEWTRGPLDNAAASPLGQDYAAYLLGLPSTGQIDWNAGRSGQSGYYAFFAQDDWRVSSSLTLNLGLRLEADVASTERYNRTVNGFAFNESNPVEAAAKAAYAARPIPEIAPADFRVRGGLLFASPDSRAVYDAERLHFSPRIGFAWRPAVLGSKSVLRGGFGIFYDSLGNGTGIVQTGFFTSTPYVTTLDGYLTPARTLSNPFPSGINPPTGSSLGLATYLGQSVNFFTRGPMNPYSFKWNLNVQRELARNLVMELGYAANHAVHLAVDQAANFIPRQYLSSAPLRDQAVINNLTGQVSNPFAGLIPGTNLNGTTVARNQLLRAHPQ